MPTVDIRIGDVNEGGEQRFHFSALKAIQQALVEELRDYGLIAVWVQFDSEELGLDDSNQPADFRAGKHQTLNLILWTGTSSQVRTIATGERLNVDGPGRINSEDTVHQRIRANSPVQPGDLLWRDEIDDYVFRLNRHPGRRVDVAIAATGGPANPESAGVDYLVSENKPWSVYGQVSNTGTKATNEWRERIGFTHNQVTGHDDILRADWITAGGSDANAINISYERPIFSGSGGERFRGKVYGSWSRFKASDVGQAAAAFEGRTWAGGGDITWNFYQHGSWFGDVLGGARFQNVRLEDKALATSGQDNFLIPYLGARFERATDRSTTALGLSIEHSVGAVTHTEPVLNDVGRRNSSDNWNVLKYDLSESFYLEPLFNDWAGAGKNGKLPFPATLAHEVAFSARGQHAFDKRLIANEQEVAGGLYSVRGYQESVASGDSVFIGTAEYRFHLARALGISDPGFYGKKPMSMFGSDFRYTPQGEYGAADWDLICRAFTDVGRTVNNKRLVGENNLTLWGAGVGAELQWKRNVSLRVDLGFALKSANDNGNQTNSGDARLHFSLTVLY
jgi:outer membrane protein assembly factor BamA